ncbi:MAG TPA: 30S ribosomal protein S21 [Candidatus Eisenbacteria bacterium]|jgi:small subunit ribosomal protein S21
MMTYVRDREPLAKALKRFKKHVEEAGILGELRQRMGYVKPSERRRRKRDQARRRHERKQA